MSLQAHRPATGVASFLRGVFLACLALYLSSCSNGGGSRPSAVSSGSAGSPPEPTYSVTLAWDAPTENEDGSTLDDLAGYKIYDRTEPGPFTYVTDVGATNQFTLDLPAGDYEFAVTAYDSSGNESATSADIPATLPSP